MSELGSDRLSEEDRRSRRGGFGTTAATYDRVRPAYPSALFDEIARYSGSMSGARVLEIGAGTGKATDPLLHRGWRVTALEIDPDMASVLRGRLGDLVDVRVEPFEEWIGDAAFDLVLCATAFHWLDPTRRVDAVADALRPGGTAAIVWTRHVRGGTQAFFDAAQACYAAWTDADPAMRLPAEQEAGSKADEFRESDRFADVTSRRFVADLEYGVDDYLGLITTYSETIALDEPRRDGLLGCLRRRIEAEFDGRVVKRHLFELVLARRV